MGDIGASTATWACPGCGLVNQSVSLECQVCNIVRPVLPRYVIVVRADIATNYPDGINVRKNVNLGTEFENPTIRQIAPGTIVHAHEKRINIEGVIRYRIDDGWISFQSLNGQQLLDEISERADYVLSIEWCCLVCTIINQPSSLSCTGCAAPKPTHFTSIKEAWSDAMLSEEPIKTETKSEKSSKKYLSSLYSKFSSSMQAVVDSSFTSISPSVNPSLFLPPTGPTGIGMNNNSDSGRNNSSELPPRASFDKDWDVVDADTSSYTHTLLSGEETTCFLKGKALIWVEKQKKHCSLMITNYRVCLMPSPKDLPTLVASNLAVESFLTIPFGCIDKMTKEGKLKDPYGLIELICKDLRVHRIWIKNSQTSTSESDTDKIFRVMREYAFPRQGISHVFAFLQFFHRKKLPSLTFNGVELINSPKPSDYDHFLIHEFSRQEIIYEGGPWVVAKINEDFRICDSYPEIVVIPSNDKQRAIPEHRFFSLESIKSMAKFRAGDRFPVLTWGDKETGATLWRSSQPKTGVSGSNAQDQKYLDFIAHSCVTEMGAKKEKVPILNIVDCRPLTSAMANRAAGAGYESQTDYPNSRLEFYDIGNIHVMRDSYNSLANLIRDTNPGSNDVYFTKQIEDTQWLSHVRLVLKCGYETANFLRKGEPVLVHCSHGWDRTAQVCALAELLLDKYYRTMDGFKVLVEKDWNTFGHAFEMRIGHAQDEEKRKSNEISPIFLQFLDCVWQLLKQYPHYFEFNARYLLVIADHLFSCRFGTFLFSTDHSRKNFQVREKCMDIWTYLYYSRHVFLNPLYIEPTEEKHILLPPIHTLLRNVTLWTDYYLRWAAVPSILSAPRTLVEETLLPVSKENDCESCNLVSKSVNPIGILPPNILITHTFPTSSLSSSSSSSSSVPPPHQYLSPSDINIFPDLQVPAMVTSDDHWEAKLRQTQQSLLDIKGRGGSTQSGNTSHTNTISRRISALVEYSCNDISDSSEEIFQDVNPLHLIPFPPTTPFPVPVPSTSVNSQQRMLSLQNANLDPTICKDPSLLFQSQQAVISQMVDLLLKSGVDRNTIDGICTNNGYPALSSASFYMSPPPSPFPSSLSPASFELTNGSPPPSPRHSEDRDLANDGDGDDVGQVGTEILPKGQGSIRSSDNCNGKDMLTNLNADAELTPPAPVSVSVPAPTPPGVPSSWVKVMLPSAPSILKNSYVSSLPFDPTFNQDTVSPSTPCRPVEDKLFRFITKIKKINGSIGLKLIKTPEGRTKVNGFTDMENNPASVCSPSISAGDFILRVGPEGGSPFLDFRETVGAIKSAPNGSEIEILIERVVGEITS